MKGSGVGSVGVSGGARGALSTGIGARASSASTGSKAFGVSLSLEARSNVASISSFSPKDQGMMINRSAITRPSSSNKMFDKGRAHVPNFTIPHEARVRPSAFKNTVSIWEKPKTGDVNVSTKKEISRVAETGPRQKSVPNLHHGRETKPTFINRPKGILDIQHGRAPKFQFARTDSLVSKRAIIDQRRSFVPRPIGEARVGVKTKTEAKQIPKISLENVLFERPKAVPLRRVEVARQTEKLIGKKRIPESTKATKTEAKTSRQMNEKGIKRMKLSHMITIAPDIEQDTLLRIRNDIKDAKKMVYLVARTRNVSVATAQAELAGVLAKKYEGKVSVKELPKVQAEAQVQVQPVN